MNVQEAVEILACARPSRYRFEREFAVAVISGWLNAPSDPHAPATTLFAALNQAVLYGRRTSTPPASEWLGEVFDAQAYLDGLNTMLALPAFWEVEEHLGYNHCRYAADLVRFLLTFRTKDLDKRKRASLGKAWEFINKHGGFVKGQFGFGKKAWCSTSGHQLIWRDYKRSAPFQCVRFHSSKLDWYLDPRQPDFLDRLIATAACEQDLTTFFREARDVQERLRAVIDERAMTAEDVLLLPSELTPSECRLPAMTSSAYGKMAGYRRTTTSAAWE